MTGTLTPLGDLSIATIAFFTPALAISLYINIRHGFSKQQGWLYLLLLSIVRLIGSICVLYSDLAQDYSSGLLTTAFITTAIGTAPLILALMGFMERVNAGMSEGRRLKNLVFQPLRLLALVGLVLAIVGGVEEADAKGPNDPKLGTGHQLMQAGSLLFLVVLLCLIAITALFFQRKVYAIRGERKLIYAGLVAVPFLIVRISYSIAVAFATNPSSAFYYTHVSIWAEAFMRFLMEAIVVMLFIGAGLATPRAETRMEAVAMGDYGKGGQVEGGAFQQQQPQQHQTQERSLGDYRPSRLIMSAWRSRRS